MESKHELTFKELYDCDIPLCPLQIYTEGFIEESGSDCVQVSSFLNFPIYLNEKNCIPLDIPTIVVKKN